MVVAADFKSNFQIEFVNRLDERLECPICKNVFSEPWQTSCGHRFCRNCFEGLFRSGNPKCPIDGEPISRDESFQDKCCEREVLNLQCFCRYKEKSCDWKGEFRHLKTHEESCQYGDAQCPACGETMERRHLQRHRENDCVNRAVACTYCGAEVRQSNMKDHLEVCLKFPISCILDCGKEDIPRGMMEEHVTTHCPKAEHLCPFSCHGCEFKILLAADEFSGITMLSSAESPCESFPCENGGTCRPLYETDDYICTCRGVWVGKNCEMKPRTNCRELSDNNLSEGNKAYPLKLGYNVLPVYCHMTNDLGTCGSGGWTLVMKIDGNKSTFHYHSDLWSNKIDYNLTGGETGFDTQETKLPTYWNTPFSKMCLGMKIDHQIHFIVINEQANSLYSLIADGQYRATSLGRNTWKKLIGSQASLQTNCSKEGFNAAGSVIDSSMARIGFLGNEQNDCATPDSRIGFGTGGYHDDSNTCGNEATHLPDNGHKHVKAMGYILVQ